MNALRTLHCTVSGGALSGSRVGYTSEASRVQPALSYDPGSGQFVLAFREQNFLTSLRVTRKDWSSSFWPAAAQLAGTTTSTAPALAAAPSGRHVMWYGGE
jgi:hypothetical protein